MDKDVKDAFKLLSGKITEGFTNIQTDIDSIRQDMATKQDIDSIRTDIDSIRQDMATKQNLKDLESRIRKIVREEVQDIRKDIEARCSPSPTE